jgi:hypothetical protein
MGFFSALFKAATTTQPPREVIIQFDANWYDSWQALEIEEGSNPSSTGISVSVSFEDDLLEEICASIENHEASERILYDEEQQPINNVGESYRQESIAKFCTETTAEDLGWMSGFLLPEMANPHDKTAVAIYVIKRLNSGEDKFELLHGGYMDKESAKKVHKNSIEPQSWDNDTLPKLLTQEVPLYAHAINADFIDIGIPADYARAQQFNFQINPSPKTSSL